MSHQSSRPMRFLLVYPEIPDTYWSYRYALPFIGKRALMPPLGLATIAAMIPREHEVRVVDLNVEELATAELAAADLVLASAMIVQNESLARLIARSRSAGVPIAVGGPYATSTPDAVSEADHLVLGEGEVSFPRFLDDFLSQRAERRYEAETKPEITTAPVPRFDLLNMHWYDTIPLQFSRGCPFDCEFCDIVQLFGHRSRCKTPEQFTREMDAAFATGFRGALFVVDDNFIGNRRKVKALLRAVIRWQEAHGYPFSLSTEASIDLAEDPELLELMVRAGFKMVFIGIESPVEGSLEAAGKRQNLRRDIATSIRMIQQAGIEVTGGFIIGFDSDPPEIFDLQIDFIQELAIPTAMVGMLMALPNTRLYQRLEAEGRILSAANGNNTHGTLLNFQPRLPVELLEAGYRRVIATIYDPRVYFNRCLALLRRYPRRSGERAPRTRSRTPIALRELAGLARSLMRQTFSPYGPEYLRYLALALLRRPDQIVRIVTMAVEGHHFFTMTRKTVGRRIARATRSRTVGIRQRPAAASRLAWAALQAPLVRARPGAARRHEPEKPETAGAW